MNSTHGSEARFLRCGPIAAGTMPQCRLHCADNGWFDGVDDQIET